MKIVIEGTMSTMGSYGMVNLNLGRSLAQRGNQVAFVPFDSTYEGLRAVIGGSEFAGLPVTVGEPPGCPDVRIRQMWPPVWVRRNPGEFLVVIQPWEFGSVPLEWLDGIANVDAVWVPSEYCKRGYLQSGVDPGKVWVVPNGFDLPVGTIFEKPHRSKIKLLFLGGTIFRKGIDVLVEALDRLEPAQLHGMELTIKEAGAGSFYRDQSMGSDLLDSHPRVNAVTTLNRADLARNEVMKLISDCDLLVHPYRSEGFGLPVLEAMSLGTPIMHTQGGATNEFCGSEESFLVPSTLKVADEPRVGKWTLADRCYWQEPSIEELSRMLSEFLSGEVAVGSKIERAMARAAVLSWSNAAEVAEASLEALRGGRAPQDSLSRLHAKLAQVLSGGEPVSPASISSLVSVGDVGSALELARLAEGRIPPEQRVEMALVCDRLSSIKVSTHDVWSGGPYRAALASANFAKGGMFSYVHDFEGGDQATYAIAQYLSGYFGGCSSVVDLACGQGSMMRVLRSQGKSVQGVEADPQLVSALRRDGFKVFEGYVPGDLGSFEFDRFDGVFLGHIVEHLDPANLEALLDWIFENVAGNGIVLVQTPDFSNPQVGSDNFWLDASHIRPYPIALLKSMFSKTGFLPVEGACRRIPEIAPLDAIAMGRRVPRPETSVTQRSSAVSGLVDLAHFALFNGESGFSQASKLLLDEALCKENGFDLHRVAVDGRSNGAAVPSSPYMPLQLASRDSHDIAIVDVPAGWLAAISAHVRARYRVARTTFEAKPLAFAFQGALRSFDEVWCFSGFDAEILGGSGYPKDAIRQMRPGIALPNPESVRTQRESARRDRFRFLSVFNFEPRKNPEALARAFVTVASEIPDVELVLKLGGIAAEDFGKWLDRVVGADSKIFEGRLHLLAGTLSRDTLFGLYLESDAFVLATRGEGYGLPFLESLAHGLPTICPDVGGHREFCNEENSFLVSTSLRPAAATEGAGVFGESYWLEVDHDDLVSKMLECITAGDRLTKMSEKALSDAERFDVAGYRSAAMERICEIRSSV